MLQVQEPLVREESLPVARATYPTASRDDLALATCLPSAARPQRGGRCFRHLALPQCTRMRSQPYAAWSLEVARRAPRSIVPHSAVIISCAASLPDRTPTAPRLTHVLCQRAGQASNLAMMPFRHVRARRCAAATHHAPRACLFLTASPVLCRRREQPSAEPERIGTGGALDAGASLLRVLAATESTPGRRSFAEHREGRPGAQNASASAPYRLACQCVVGLLSVLVP